MGAKNEKKKRSGTSAEKQDKFLSLEEMKAKEMQCLSKVMELKKCLKFIEDAQLEIRRIREQQLLQNKWEDFLSCNPLPKPYIPPDIRLFNAKLKYWEKESVNNNISWLLSVDERSILSQDIFRQDLTRNKLDTTLRKNIGHEYNNYISDSLSVLQRIEYFLDNEVEVAKCPLRILDDIKQRKSAVQQDIVYFIDSFTYRIISSENAEMNSIDALTAEYFFNALNFNIHIWCLKNVALRFNYLSEPRLLANFSSINLKLHIPADMLRDNLVIRALHMKFDHLSENARSYKHVLSASAEHLSSHTLELPDAVMSEWSMQMDMQDKKLNEMKQKYAQYEILKQQYIEQMEKQMHRNKDDTNAKKKHNLKMPKEPVVIEDDRRPDIYEEFLQEEEQRYENLMKTPFRPDLLNLSSEEINLRECVILSGIYQLYYIQKPLHTDFNSYNMTWHENESKLQIERSVRIKTGSYDVRKSNVGQTKRYTARMSVMDLNKRLAQPDVDCPWFILTFELPEHLCYWGDPIACHYEETTETKERPHPFAIVESESIVNVSELLSNSNQQQNVKAPDSENSVTSTEKPMHIDDFSLLEILTQPQLRHIERHILPRIISSYKFPKEIREEDSELTINKPKGRGARLLRQKTYEVPQDFSNKNFTFNERQNNPERTQKFFSKAEQIHVISLLKAFDFISQEEPESFAQLLQIIEDIKKKYITHMNNILDLKPLQKKIVTHNKRIRQMLRQTKQRTFSKAVSIISSLSTKSSFYKSMNIDTELSKLRIRESEETETHDLSNQAEDTSLMDDEENEEEMEVTKYSHWTTKYILKSNFDRKNCKIVIQTDRLGNFGFAFKRYEHFPFKCWNMKPSGNDPANEVVFTLDTQHVRCVLYITADGIRGHVTEPMKTFKRNPKMYLQIEKPIKDLKELKKLFKDKYLNIFAEYDAGFYIKNGYFSEKHLPNELHTYNCMAVHGTQMCFNFSMWNRIATRRDIILKFRQYQDLEDNLVEVRITPGEAHFVEIQELCSQDLNVINLAYDFTWRNIEPYSDLHHLIVSMYPAATDLRCKNSALICFVRDLLSEVRPLSFS